jgi:alpha-amylase/alpha-mannosidase (GH57 family)
MTRPLDLVLLWHMHQPDYRDHATGEFRLPWVYLHAAKDYVDMAWHLESHPGVRAVVNLVPVLLDQIEDYADQFATGRLRDPLLRLLARDPSAPLTDAERQLAVDRCFHANHDKMMKPFAAYSRLHALFEALEDEDEQARLGWLSDEYYYDLVTWYHLVWTGETVRRSHALVPELMTRGAGFSHADRIAVFELYGWLIRDVIGRYARLAASGRIEISTTPHDHPLGPLLVDFAAARDARPESPLPASPAYPGGAERLAAHTDIAFASHARRFGAPPRGVWPAEGAVSDAVLRILGRAGAAWAATGEGVLMNTLRRAGVPLERRTDYLYRPYRGAGGMPVCFFRDDRLSDLIGFEYAKWHSQDAAASFVGELERIAATAPVAETPLVSVILDGENCWEFYPYNGFYFLEALYGRLESHASIATATFAEMVARPSAAGRPPARAATLPPLVAGSWVYGDLSTWIGASEKNRAWDLLVAAKQGYDQVVGSGRLSPAAVERARRQLAVCEASDWFWWLGDYNPADAVASFERVYRANLAGLYALLGIEAPAALGESLGRGAGHPEAGGAMRRAT